MVARDWRTTLQPASFRGVPFLVDGEDLSGGRRLAKHTYAGGEATKPEDMGKAVESFDVTGYLLGDDADLKAKAIQAACSVAGPGMLIMPMDGGMMAYAEGFRRTRQRDRVYYIRFDVTFVPDGALPVAALSIGDVSAAVAAGISLAASGFSRLF